MNDTFLWPAILIAIPTGIWAANAATIAAYKHINEIRDIIINGKTKDAEFTLWHRQLMLNNDYIPLSTGFGYGSIVYGIILLSVPVIANTSVYDKITWFFVGIGAWPLVKGSASVIFMWKEVKLIQSYLNGIERLYKSDDSYSGVDKKFLEIDSGRNLLEFPFEKVIMHSQQRRTIASLLFTFSAVMIFVFAIAFGLHRDVLAFTGMHEAPIRECLREVDNVATLMDHRPGSGLWPLTVSEEAIRKSLYEILIRQDGKPQKADSNGQMEVIQEELQASGYDIAYRKAVHNFVWCRLRTAAES